LKIFFLLLKIFIFFKFSFFLNFHFFVENFLFFWKFSFFLKIFIFFENFLFFFENFIFFENFFFFWKIFFSKVFEKTKFILQRRYNILFFLKNNKSDCKHNFHVFLKIKLFLLLVFLLLCKAFFSNLLMFPLIFQSI